MVEAGSNGGWGRQRGGAAPSRERSGSDGGFPGPVFEEGEGSLCLSGRGGDEARPSGLRRIAGCGAGRQGYQKRRRARLTCEAPLEDAAVEVPRHHPVEEAAPEAVPALEEVLPGSLDRLVEGLEQRVLGRFGGPARPVCSCLHGTRPWRASCRGAENRASVSRAEASAGTDGGGPGPG